MATPNELVLQLITGYIAPRCLHIVAELGIADRIDDVPVAASELAQATGANADALFRILRLLVTHGLFAQHGDSFAHTPASRLLRADHPQSMRAFALMHGGELCWQGFGQLGQTARSGATSFPGGLFPYLDANPDFRKVFHGGMTSRAHLDTAAFVAAYDLSGAGTVADIGGGNGHLLQAVLGANPASKGILFDLPTALPKTPIASDRLSLVGGDFFKDALPRADVYLLSNILHDWPDAEAAAILTAIARAGHAGSKLLLLEGVVPEGPEPHFVKMFDVLMLTIVGGRERTAREYERLLTASGWTFIRFIPTASSRSIVEAVPS